MISKMAALVCGDAAPPLKPARPGRRGRSGPKLLGAACPRATRPGDAAAATRPPTELALYLTAAIEPSPSLVPPQLPEVCWAVALGYTRCEDLVKASRTSRTLAAAASAAARLAPARLALTSRGRLAVADRAVTQWGRVDAAAATWTIRGPRRLRLSL